MERKLRCVYKEYVYIYIYTQIYKYNSAASGGSERIRDLAENAENSEKNPASLFFKTNAL